MKLHKLTSNIKWIKPANKQHLIRMHSIYKNGYNLQFALT